MREREKSLIERQKKTERERVREGGRDRSLTDRQRGRERYLIYRGRARLTERDSETVRPRDRETVKLTDGVAREKKIDFHKIKRW